jgi:hypothetical protein
MGDMDSSLDYLGVFLSINPVWARMKLPDNLYQPLRDTALFKSGTK